jgi:4-diphosphocytidyl-2-C-methyl-D-erythritol kinase
MPTLKKTDPQRIHPAPEERKMADTLLIDSPAKINLSLDILGKRDDGYHEIRTLLQKISLHDTIRFSLGKKRGISISTNHPSLPVGKENLVYRAAAMLLERSKFEEGVSIRIRKRIPIGAGLGGGSSNAAATLKALNQLLGTGYSQRELMKMGLMIGADVPFFLIKGSAIGAGIGEKLKKVELPHLWYLLINPNFEVSTRWAYQNFVLTKRRFHYNIHKFSRKPSEILRILRNDLEEVVKSSYPQIDTMIEILRAAGAAGASMTGSGPTVFGIFFEERSATEAFRKAKRSVKEEGWTILKAESISA